MLCLVTQSCLTLSDPMDCNSVGSSVHGDSPGKNTGGGCRALLLGSSPTQGLNPGLPHCRLILYHLSHQRRPRIWEWVAYPFPRGSSWPRNQTGVSWIASKFFTSWATREALLPIKDQIYIKTKHWWIIMQVHSSVYIHTSINKQKNCSICSSKSTLSFCIDLKIDRYHCFLKVQRNSPQPCSECIQFLSNSPWEFKRPHKTTNFTNNIIFLNTVGPPVSCKSTIIGAILTSIKILK